jgi:hypothetical protein
LRPDGGADFMLLRPQVRCCQYFMKTLRPTRRYVGEAASVRGADE